MGGPSESPVKRLILEVHRRSLWQVLAIYLAGGWIAFEAVQTLTEGLGLPDWFPALALVLLLIGLPVVLATAFVQEGGPGQDLKPREGAESAEAVQANATRSAEHGSPTTSRRLFTWRNAIMGGVGALAVWGMVAGGWLLFGGGPPGEERDAGASSSTDLSAVDPSVAVLPFDNLSADPEQQFFSDGVADQILNALTRIPGLKVTARTSSFAFRDADLDIRTIADSLGVANVLEGTVQRAGDRIRITAQLIEAETAFHLWSETYNRELTDVFEVQDDVARRIADALRVELSGVVGGRLAASGTESAAAHDHYLRGRQLLYQRTPEGIRGAIEAFRQSVEADPSYAPSWVGLATAYTFGEVYSAAPPDSSYAWAGRSLAHADRAIELDPTNAEAYAVRGAAVLLVPAAFVVADEAIDQMERDFQRALELQPSSADALGWYAQGLSAEGRHEAALAMQERSIALDPVSPGRRMGYMGSAVWAGDNALALEQVRRARSIQPGLGGIATGWEMWNLVQVGRADECLELDDRLRSFEPLCLHAAGRVGEAQALVDSLAAEWSPDDPWLETEGIMRYYAMTGRLDDVVVWLERGMDASSYFSGAYLWPDLWDPILTADDGRVRRTLSRLAEESWARVEAERRRSRIAGPA